MDASVAEPVRMSELYWLPAAAVFSAVAQVRRCLHWLQRHHTEFVRATYPSVAPFVSLIHFPSDCDHVLFKNTNSCRLMTGIRGTRAYGSRHHGRATLGNRANGCLPTRGGHSLTAPPFRTTSIASTTSCSHRLQRLTCYAGTHACV